MTMALPRGDRATGTKRPHRHHGTVHGGRASQPRGGRHKHKKKTSMFDIEALNPPFDERMRRIGSPLNQTVKMKRGWVQNADGDKKVNFLFNPPSLTVSHAITDILPTSNQTGQQSSAQADVTTAAPAATGQSLGIQLLYDRTYEMFSVAHGASTNMANEYGVWADVAAWYTYLGMFDEMPTSWDESLIKTMPGPVLTYLFMGPRMFFYGWITALNVTYSHWTQNMVPVRCAIDISFDLQPDPGKRVWQGQGPANINPFDGWMGDWLGDLKVNPDGSVDDNTPDNGVMLMEWEGTNLVPFDGMGTPIPIPKNSDN